MEKKKRNLFIGIGVAVVVAVAALCFIFCKGGSDKYCSAIPKDAAVFVRIDAPSFIDKHNIDMDGMKSQMGPMASMFDNTGIDFDKPLYAFVTPKGATGIVAKMESTEDLKNLVKTLGAMMQAKVTEKQGYNWIEMNGMLICFDKNKLLAMQGAGMNARKDMIALMEQDEDESIMATKTYQNLANVKEPFAMIASYKSFLQAANLPKETIEKTEKMYGLTMEELSEADIVITLDAVKDKFVMAFEMCPNNDKVKSVFDKYFSQLKKINGDYINSIHENPIMWGTFNVSGELVKTILTSVATQGADDLNMQQIQSLSKIFESLDGDFTFTLPSVEEPNFIVQAKVKNNKILDIIPLLTESTENQIKALKMGDNAYTLSLGETPMFIGVNNGTFYFTNVNTMVENVGKEVKSNIAANEQEIKDAYCYFTIDATQVVNLLSQDPRYSSMIQQMKSKFDKLDRLTMVCSNPMRGELYLSVKDGEDIVDALLK